MLAVPFNFEFFTLDKQFEKFTVGASNLFFKINLLEAAKSRALKTVTV